MISGTWLWRVAQKLRDYGPGEDIVGDGFPWGLSIVDPALDQIFGKGNWRKQNRHYRGKTLVWVEPLEVDSETGKERGGLDSPQRGLGDNR